MKPKNIIRIVIIALILEFLFAMNSDQLTNNQLARNLYMLMFQMEVLLLIIIRKNSDRLKDHDAYLIPLIIVLTQLIVLMDIF